MKVDVLNLGAGNKILASNAERTVVNHDRIQHRPEISVAHDLDLFPWPWEGESFDLIVARAVLEHLRCTLLESVGECWRILRPGGELALKIPNWNHENSYADPTHHWQFSLQTPCIFDPETDYGRAYSFYTDRKWEILRGPKLNSAGSSIHVRMRVRK